MIGVYINSTTNVSGSPAYGQHRWAQTITPDTSNRLRGFGLRIATSSYPSVSGFLQVQTTIAGRPSGVVLVEKAIVVPYGIGNTFLEFLLDASIPRTLGLKYAVVLASPQTTLNVLGLGWQTTFSQDIYAGGDLFHSVDGGANWNLLNEPPDNLQNGEDGFVYEILDGSSGCPE